ncbi:MAG: hypothetical protein ACKVQJ_08575 [Pyrinomonadaceae bacterium]
MKVCTHVFSLAIVAFLILGVVLGCGGGVSNDACISTVAYQGKTFEGKAKDADEAARNACNNYCRDADPEYEARYGIWLESPKGKAAGSPSKQEAIFKDKDLMSFVTETCSKKCVADMKPEAKCK